MATDNNSSQKKASMFEKISAGFASKSLLIIILFGILVVVALGSAVYFYLQYQKTQDLLKNPSSNAQQEVNSLVSEVGSLIELPQGEQPQVATVSDINKLKEQQFFSRAKNGDKVLIYTKAQKAILYDPIAKKVVEVGPINLTSASPTVAPTPANLKIALYNGTTTVGLTTKIEQKLATSMPTVTVVVKENASKSTYDKTIVVDVTGKQSAAAHQIASLLGGEVGPLPTGEEKPASGEIIVILGKQ